MGPMSLKLFLYPLMMQFITKNIQKHDFLMKSNWSHTLLSNNMVALITVLDKVQSD
jgi:hypothetical protein